MRNIRWSTNRRAISFLVVACTVVSGAWGFQCAAQGIKITLDPPTQVFHEGQPDALGLFNVPDMHTVVLQQSNRSYLVWITGNIGPVAGSVARLSTTDFLHYTNSGQGSPAQAEPVFTPSCRTANARAPTPPRGRGGRFERGGRDPGNTKPPSSFCLQNDDADYVGANAVFPARNGRDLLMLYEAGNKSIGNRRIAHGWEFNVVALARSSDQGRTWTREGTVVSGPDPKPTAETGVPQPGISEFGALTVGTSIYLFYQYVPNSPKDAYAPAVIEAALAPRSGDGAAGTWKKFFNGSFSEPGIGGKATPIVHTGSGTACTRPVEVTPAFVTDLKLYVLTFVCDEGWFYSTSADLVRWSDPVNFMPMHMWKPCKPMDWNYVLVTPGNPAGVLGLTGYVLYAHTDARGTSCGTKFSAHELWVRPFTFSKSP